MRVSKRAYVSAIAIAASALTIGACGAWQAPSPVGPSKLPGPAVLPPAPTSGTTISGVVNSVNGVRRFGTTATTTSTNITVTVVGTDISAPVDFFGRFVLQGAPAGSIRLHFSGPGVDAVINVGTVQDREQIDLEISLRGSTGAVESSIRIAADNTTQVEGPVTNVSGSCANLSVTVHGWTLNLTSSTQSACDSVQIGVRIRIRGHRESSNVISVVTLQMSTQQPTPDSDDDDQDDDDR